MGPSPPRVLSLNPLTLDDVLRNVLEVGAAVGLDARARVGFGRELLDAARVEPPRRRGRWRAWPYTAPISTSPVHWCSWEREKHRSRDGSGRSISNWE